MRLGEAVGNHLEEPFHWKPLGIDCDEAGLLEHALHLDGVDCDHKDTPIALREPPCVVGDCQASPV